MSSLPVGWALATLDDLLASEPRAITDGPFGSNLKSEHYTDSGARVIRLQNIGDGFFRDERAFVSLAHFERLRAHEVRSGDLVVASLGEELPRACLVPRLDVPAIVKADCIRVRLHPSIETRWVLYCLIAPQTRRLATARIKGVGRPRLGLGQLRQLSIPVPPLAEQRRIIETLEGHLSQLDAADGYLSRAKNRIPALRGSVREHAIEHQAEYLLLPASGAGWHRGTLGDVVTRIEAGKSFVCQPRPAEPDEWGVIKVSAMTWGQFQESENKAVPTDRLVDPRFEIRAGDVLVSRANTEQYVGAPVLVGQCRPRLLLSDKSLRLVPRVDVDPRWLVEALSSPGVRRQISAGSTGMKESMRNVSQATLLAVELLIPPPELQVRVAEHLSSVLGHIERLDSEVDVNERRAKLLRSSLLAEAFSGRLVPQSPNDEPASVLLERIRAERAAQPGRRRGRRRRAEAGEQEVLL